MYDLVRKVVENPSLGIFAKGGAVGAPPFPGRPVGRYYRPMVALCLNGRYSWICGRYYIKMAESRQIFSKNPGKTTVFVSLSSFCQASRAGWPYRAEHRNGTFVPPAPPTRTRRRVKTDFRRKTGRSGPFFISPDDSFLKIWPPYGTSAWV